MLTGERKINFLIENRDGISGALLNTEERVLNEISSMQDDFDAMLPDGIQANDLDCADYVRRMSEKDCQKALLTSTKLIGRYQRFRQIVVKDQELCRFELIYYNRECDESRTLSAELATKVDRLNAELTNAEKKLMEVLEELNDAFATNDQICKLASGALPASDTIDLAPKKNARMPVTSRLERSLAFLKQKLESLESSHVSQKDFEARGKEIDALKAENAKILENVRNAHADRQRALKDNESLREQLQKLRVEKQADGSGKKKKNK